MGKTKYKILCIDDEQSVLEILKDALDEIGFEVVFLQNPKQAEKILKEIHQQTALIIADYRMPEMDGFELREALLKDYEDIPFLMLSGFITKEMALQAMERKISAFVHKPCEIPVLLETVKKESAKRVETLAEEEELLENFLDESQTMMEEMEDLIMSLQSSPEEVETLNGMFRILHTIKGLSGFFKPDTINKFSHHMEDFLSPFKKEEAEVTPPVVEAFLKGYDTLCMLFDSMRNRENKKHDIQELTKIFDLSVSSQSGPIPKSKGSQASKEDGPSGKKESARDWVKAPISLLDKFMRRSGENTVLRNMINKLVKSIELQVKGCREIAELVELLEEMHEINTGTQSDIMELRKVPIKDVYRPLQRTIREVSVSLGKKVNFQTVGDDLKVDTAIADVLRNSLIHMIRNSLDHGMETPEERLQKEKKEECLLQLNCIEVGDVIQMEIMDDGRGIDPNKIREKLIEKNLYSPEEAQDLSDKEVLLKIFDSGFSTAKEVTDVSGRGIGMDQVKESVEKIGGSIDVDSKIGEGTQIKLTLPVPKSVEIITSIIARVGKRQFAVPRSNVLRILQLDQERQTQLLKELEGVVFISFEGKLVPLAWVSDLLNISSSNCHSSWKTESSVELPIIVLNDKDVTYALVVDEILDSEETVVKSLPDFLKGKGAFSGSTFQGDGLPGLILNIKGLGLSKGLSKLGRRNNTQETVDLSEKSSKKFDVTNSSEFLIVKLAGGKSYAIPLTFVNRLENFSRKDIQLSGHAQVVNYGEKVLPLIWVNEFFGFNRKEEDQDTDSIPTIIIQQEGQTFGLVVEDILDVRLVDQVIDNSVRDREGILGNLILDVGVVVVVDIWHIINAEAKRLGMQIKVAPEDENDHRGECHILYAEDVDFYKEYISKGLRKAGFEVTAVSSGKEALQELQKHDSPGEVPFSLVLTDIQMPEMNGFDLTKNIKKDQRFSTLPVVALTAHMNTEDVQLGKEAGFDGYIEKLNIARVVKAIDKLLPLDSPPPGEALQRNAI